MIHFPDIPTIAPEENGFFGKAKWANHMKIWAKNLRRVPSNNNSRVDQMQTLGTLDHKQRL